MISSSIPDGASRGADDRLTLPWAAIFFLLLTAVISLVWSHCKLMSQDEFFVLQTDSVSRLAQLIHIQRAYPISLDPLVYHVLAHEAIEVFGPGAFAIRLPSLLGFLLMQICLFFFVRRFATEQAALFALAFPALTATLFYSAEGRPYGLLLGFYGLAMLSWQTATRRTTSRTAALLTLALAIALTLNTHYFGILLLLPLCAAEIFRSIQRRRLDRPVAAAIVLGMASIVFALPFEKAASEFRKHYYNAGQVGYHAITQSYRALFVDYTDASRGIQQIASIGFVLFAVLLIFGCIRQLHGRHIELPGAELFFLVVLAALPFSGFLLARFVTHSIEVRYVLGAILAISILLAIAAAPLFRRAGVITLCVLAAAIALAGVVRIHAEQAKTRELLSSLQLSPSVKAAVLSSPTGLLYIQDMAAFDTATFYEPDSGIRSRIALVYSAKQELLWDKHDTTSLTAEHMRRFTGFRILPYDRVSAEPGAHIFILRHSGWNWTDQAFAAAHDRIAPLGPAMQGDAASVQFTPQ